MEWEGIISVAADSRFIDTHPESWFSRDLVQQLAASGVICQADRIWHLDFPTGLSDGEYLDHNVRSCGCCAVSCGSGSPAEGRVGFGREAAEPFFNDQRQ